MAKSFGARSYQPPHLSSQTGLSTIQVTIRTTKYNVKDSVRITDLISENLLTSWRLNLEPIETEMCAKNGQTTGKVKEWKVLYSIDLDQFSSPADSKEI